MTWHLLGSPFPPEQRRLVGGRFAVIGWVVGQSEVFVGVAGGLPALADADDEADLQEIEFDHVFEGVALLAYRRGQGFDARGARASSG